MLSTSNILSVDVEHAHHERVDGNGYARGLKGAATPSLEKDYFIKKAHMARPLVLRCVIINPKVSSSQELASPLF